MSQRSTVSPLTRLCLQSIAENMESLWLADYTERYMEEYTFLYIEGPFNQLAGVLIQELIQILGDSHRLTRAGLHVLLQPHLSHLNLRTCSKLVNNGLIQLVRVRCRFLTSLDLHSCHQVGSPSLTLLVEGLPRLLKLCLSGTQCDAPVLSALAASCPKLRELDISHCKKLTPSSLLCLAYDAESTTFCCQSLRALLLQDFHSHNSLGQWVHALTFLLLALPNLEQLSTPLLPHALRLIHSSQFSLALDPPGDFPSLAEVARARRAVAGGCNGRLNVPSPHNGASPRESVSTRDAAAIILHLKDLEELSEEEVGSVGCLCEGVEKAAILLGAQPGLGRSLLQWPCLTHLTLHSPDLPSRTLQEMLPVLASVGERLRFLSLQNLLWCEGRSLRDLLTMCPNLRAFRSHLTPRGLPGLGDGPDAERPPLDEPSIPLPQLQDFSLILEEVDLPLHPRLTHSIGCAVASVLRGGPMLETLSLCGIPYNLDLVLEAVLASASPPLPKLRVVSLCRSNVTVWGASLILRVGKELKSVDLSHCKEVTRRDHHDLKERVKKEQLGVHITWQ